MISSSDFGTRNLLPLTPGLAALPHLAYVIYWGATEPLGQSLLVPAVERLAETHRITLVTFEKPQDMADKERVSSVRDRFETARIRWVPLKYRKSPPVLSSFLDAWRGVRVLRKVHRKDPFDIIEGRTFVGGLIGERFSAKTNVPLIYHTEGCWVDEQVDHGKWSEGSLPHRIGRWLDRRIHRRARGVVVLTRSAAEQLRSNGGLADGKPIAIIPSTSVLVDMATVESLRIPRVPGDGLRFIYVGSVGGKYLFSSVLDLVSTALELYPNTVLQILAHRDHEFIHTEVRKKGLESSVSLERAELVDVPQYLKEADAGIFFLQQGLTGPCVSPTKVGEYLAYGLPVLTSAEAGDGIDIIREADAGVVLDSLEAVEFRRTLERLPKLVADESLPLRAYKAAKEHYSLDEATSRQTELLENVL